MSLVDRKQTSDAKVTEAGEGRPVLVLGAGSANSAAIAALAKRFRVFAMQEGDAAAWISAQKKSRPASRSRRNA